MSTHELDHALQMLEQICANFAWDEDRASAAATAATHIKRFWTPVMRSMVCEDVAAGRATPSESGLRVVALIG